MAASKLGEIAHQSVKLFLSLLRRRQQRQLLGLVRDRSRTPGYDRHQLGVAVLPQIALDLALHLD